MQFPSCSQKARHTAYRSKPPARPLCIDRPLSPRRTQSATRRMSPQIERPQDSYAQPNVSRRTSTIIGGGGAPPAQLMRYGSLQRTTRQEHEKHCVVRTASYVCCRTDRTACAQVEECWSKSQFPLVDAAPGPVLFFWRMFLLRTANMTELSYPITAKTMMRVSRVSLVADPPLTLTNSCSRSG
jgi:hypothetical protein